MVPWLWKKWYIFQSRPTFLNCCFIGLLLTSDKTEISLFYLGNMVFHMVRLNFRWKISIISSRLKRFCVVWCLLWITTSMIRWEICSILITRSALFSLGLLFIEVTHMFLLNWRSVFEQPLKWRIIIWISDVGLGWIRRWYQGSLWLNASNNNDRVKKEVSKDEEMLKLVVAIASDHNCFPDAIAVYNKLKDSLSVVDGVPMYRRHVSFQNVYEMFCNVYIPCTSALSGWLTEQNILFIGQE